MRHIDGLAVSSALVAVMLGCGGGGPSVPEGTDLRIPGVSGNAFVDWGNQLVLDVTCRNHGRTDADADTELRCYFSDDDTLDAGLDMLLSSHTVTALQMTAETEEIIADTLTMPSSGMEGQYYLIYAIDEDNDVTEEIEDNNILVFPLYVGPKTLPDLEVIDVSGPNIEDPILSGQSRTVQITVRNNGVPCKDTFVARVYLSTGTTPSGSALAQRYMSDLCYLEECTVSASVLIPADTTTGNYRFVVVADESDIITEESEANNSNYSVQFYVRYKYPGDDMYEPDDFAEHANTLPLTGTAQVHTSYPITDEDWLTFTLAATTTVTINVYNQTNGGDCQTFLYDSSMNELAWNWGDYIAAPYTISMTLGPGTYYVMTMELWDYGYGAAGGQYTISATAN